MSMSEFTEIAVSSRDDSTAYRFLDTLSYVRISGDETAGRCSIVEMQLREGHAPPMHVHQEADETIHVLEGMVTAHTANTTRSVSAGESIVFPRGESHSLVADEQSIIVASSTPAGFEEFLTAVGQPTQDEAIPTDPPSEDAIGRVNALAQEHEIEIVGPPPVSP